VVIVLCMIVCVYMSVRVPVWINQVEVVPTGDKP